MGVISFSGLKRALAHKVIAEKNAEEVLQELEVCKGNRGSN